MTYGYAEEAPKTDTEIIAALVVLQRASPAIQNELGLTTWECKFIGALPEIWEHTGVLTWKQRRAGRMLVLKIHARLKRRADLRALLEKK